MASSPTFGLTDEPDLGTEKQGAYLRVHAVTIFVRDQQLSLDFYVNQLGFDLAFDARLQSGERWVAVRPRMVRPCLR
jgi:hypothetical protein